MSAAGAAPPARTADRRNPILVPSGGVWLRLLLAAALVPILTTVWQPVFDDTTYWLQLAAMVVVGGWTVLRPDGPGLMIVFAAVLADRIFRGSSTLDGTVLLLVVLVPVAHMLAALAAAVPARSSLALSALLPSALRLAGALLATLVVVLVVQLTA